MWLNKVGSMKIETTTEMSRQRGSKRVATFYTRFVVSPQTRTKRNSSGYNGIDFYNVGNKRLGHQKSVLSENGGIPVNRYLSL